jgi:hypothetical protein
VKLREEARRNDHSRAAQDSSPSCSNSAGSTISYPAFSLSPRVMRDVVLQHLNYAFELVATGRKPTDLPEERLDSLDRFQHHPLECCFIAGYNPRMHVLLGLISLAICFICF